MTVSLPNPSGAPTYPDPSILSPAAHGRLRDARGFAMAGSVADLTALDAAGLAPLGLVHGTSTYQVPLDLSEPVTGSEVPPASQALYTARQFALARLVAEATVWRAHGVIGVVLEDRLHVSDATVVEVVASATAVRALRDHPAIRADGAPFSTRLPATELRPLLDRGLIPVAVALGTCVVRLDGPAGWNGAGEVPALTQAAFDGRETALARLQADAARRGSAGLLGVVVERRAHGWDDRAVEYLALGSAVTPAS
jgi:uncharacterized protein YbjQ (UPF0145 family)